MRFGCFSAASGLWYTYPESFEQHHAVVRKGLVTILGNMPELELVGEAR